MPLQSSLSVPQLIDLVLSRKGTTIVSFTAMTDPKLRKNPFGKVIKHSYVNGMLGFDYENSVNNQRGREELELDFKAEKRAWGERVMFNGKATPFVAHKGKTYLTVKVERSVQKARYFQADGTELTTEQVVPYLPKPSASRQDVTKQVIHREYSVGNLRSLVVGGVNYQIIGQ